MADRFTLKGAKTVVKNVGSAVRINPSRGGDTHQFPRWWSLKHKVQYIDAAIFKITLDNSASVRLVIPIDKENTEVQVRHDGNGNFSFPYYRGVDRIAVVAADNTIYKEYQFPAISKGAILTRTVNSYPAALSFTDDGSIAGTLEVGEDITLTGATYTGGVGSISELYVLQKSDTGSGGWTTVATSPTTPFTNNLSPALDGKYLRLSTQITDGTGLHVRNSSATPAVTTPVP